MRKRSKHGGRRFEYDIILTLLIRDKRYEFHKHFLSHVQLRVGDFLFVNGLEDVMVDRVVWYLESEDRALVLMQDQYRLGEASDWLCVLDDMDYSVPQLIRTEENCAKTK